MDYKEISNFSLNKNDSTIGLIFSELSDVHVIEVISKLFNAFEYCPWIFSLIGSILVGLSGVLPLLIIPIEEGENLKSGAGARRLKILLSFAVGGLLGDVFLHLLPEAWEHRIKDVHSHQHPSLSCGLWVLVGMLAFIIVEKVFSNLQEPLELKPKIIVKYITTTTTTTKANGYKNHRCDNDRQINGKVPEYCTNNNTKFPHNNHDQEVIETKKHYHISGYLNLMANSIDNFTHGLAIGGSFCISFKIGVLSTFAILVHEIPHEVGDFAILLKSGFSRWDAAKAQICTATAGIMGSMIAVVFGSSDSVESKTSWILPFTAGGFLHIALVTVLPELIKEESRLESFKQLASLILGIIVMAVLIFFTE